MNRRSKILCPDYLDFIRAKPCCACGKAAPSDPDHLSARGMGAGKQNDLTAIPLCRRCHSERGHGIAKFQAHYDVDLAAEAMWCLIEYFADPDRRMATDMEFGKEPIR